MNTKFSQRLKERLVQLNSPNLKYTTIIHFARAYGLPEPIGVLEALKSDLFTPSEVIYEGESVVNLIKTLRDLDWKDRLFYLAYFRDVKANAKVFTPDDAPCYMCLKMLTTSSQEGRSYQRNRHARYLMMSKNFVS